ncbi:UrcA family protein [Rhizomicrobium palustre]|uniref:UrcA family protein n=1 Tax=Rhizomicrobium palustre TaxID=189966 RepID=A0A846MYC8_9PROT|nr:UrcA family protein [Rhizomicrobium palustre]NIK88416.1 UrcA family protein [Rhizomicrobium palustre]
MKRIVLALSAVALLSSAASAGEIVRHKEVSFADLNLASKDGAAELHARLLNAANDVCADTKDATTAPYYEDCRAAAVKQAIAEVGVKLSKRIAAAR